MQVALKFLQSTVKYNSKYAWNVAGKSAKSTTNAADAKVFISASGSIKCRSSALDLFTEAPPTTTKEHLQRLVSKNTGVSLVFALLEAVLLTEICQHTRGQLPSAMSMQDIWAPLNCCYCSCCFSITVIRTLHRVFDLSAFFVFINVPRTKSS